MTGIFLANWNWATVNILSEEKISNDHLPSATEGKGSENTTIGNLNKNGQVLLNNWMRNLGPELGKYSRRPPCKPRCNGSH